MTEREIKLLSLLRELRKAEWMCSIDWCPQSKRDAVLQKVDAALDMFPEEEASA